MNTPPTNNDQNLPEKEKAENEQKRYSNWESNQALLAIAFVDLLNEKRRRPTLAELCGKTGLSYNTVRAHLKILDETELKEKWASFKILSEQVVLSLATTAIAGGKGSAQAAKLFLELVENWTPGMKIEFGGSVNFSGLTTEELIQRQKDNAKLLGSKLIKFISRDSEAGRTGSD